MRWNERGFYCVCVCVLCAGVGGGGGFFLISPHTSELGRGSLLPAQCGLFQRLAGNATITDHRPSKTRVALGLEGDKQPTARRHPSPAHWPQSQPSLLGGKILSTGQLTNTCQFQEQGWLLFPALEPKSMRRKKRKKLLCKSGIRGVGGKDKTWSSFYHLPTFLSVFFFYHPVSLTWLSWPSRLSLATEPCPATHLTPHQAALMEPKSCL